MNGWRHALASTSKRGWYHLLTSWQRASPTPTLALTPHTTSPQNERGPDSSISASGAVATGAAKPTWPPSSEDGGSGDDATGGGLSTPSRQALLAVQKTNVFSNPVHPSNLPPGAGGLSAAGSEGGSSSGSASSYAGDVPPPPPPVPTGATGVPVRNPFHQA